MSKTIGSTSITTLPNKIAHKLKNLNVKAPKNNPGPKCKGVKGTIKIQNSTNYILTYFIFSVKVKSLSNNRRESLTQKINKLY